ncbi:MAG: hypothetical protein AAGA30_05460 [Planctomycetota bacterium]
MFKSLLYAIGIFLLIFGAQTLFVDKWIMSYRTPAPAVVASGGNNLFRSAGYRSSASGGNYYNNGRGLGFTKPVYQSQEWMPWSLLAVGTIIILYTYSTYRDGDSG